ncbi:hypothetical protein MIMGU_mgv1a0207621mg, partial [Erythranthe guttata]
MDEIVRNTLLYDSN